MPTRENTTEAGVEAASVAAAHSSTAQRRIAEIAHRLQNAFGQRLTAYIAGIADARHVRDWRTGQRAPRYDSELRLRATEPAQPRIVVRNSPVHASSSRPTTGLLIYSSSALASTWGPSRTASVR